MAGAGPRGVGIGLRRPHFDEIAETDRAVDWLEFVPENFVGRGGKYREVLRRCAERWTLVPHGVSLSIGGPDPFPDAYVAGLRALLDEIDAPYYSDHLCYASIEGTGFYDLLPLPFIDAAAEHLGTRARELSAALGRPLVLENITYYAEMPGSDLDEGAFITRALDRAGASLLLDLNNIYVNAHNHGLVPETLLRALPLDKARHVHLAGHSVDGHRLLDSHGDAVAEGVWDLYRTLLRHAGPVPTLIEWDTRIPELDRVLDEADRARAIMLEECGTLDADAWHEGVA